MAEQNGVRAGWYVEASKGKRGKYRPQLKKDGVLKALLPVNMAFDTEKDAVDAGQEVLDAGNKEAYESGYANGKWEGEAGKADLIKRLSSDKDAAHDEGRKEGLRAGRTKAFLTGAALAGLLVLVAYFAATQS